MKGKCAAGEPSNTNNSRFLYIVPYCWLVALSTQSIKYIYLPSADVSVPTLPRPIISVMDVEVPLCVHDCIDYKE